MKVFLSWSKDLSLQIAQLFADWLPTVIQECSDPFISVDIDKGEPWFEMIRSNLAETDLGIVFITPDNMEETWLNFEAGAMLNKFGKSGVCPVLVGLKKSDYTGPMKQLQLTEIESETDMKGLLATINKKCASPLNPIVLDKIADKFWPELEASIQSTITESRSAKPAKVIRSLDDKVDEILLLARSIATLESGLSTHIQRSEAEARDSNSQGAQASLHARWRDSAGYALDPFYERRLEESDKHHEARMARFEGKYGSLFGTRKSDQVGGQIVDFAEKDGKLYWVRFRDPESGEVQKYRADEVEIFPF